MKIRPATKKDWPSILRLIRADRYLQQDRLPSWQDFFVLESNGVIIGCCALKVFGEKLAEIRSFAFKSLWLRKLYLKVLVNKCINRAKKLGVYQLLVTLWIKDKGLFEPLGFGPFNSDEKYAMLMVLQNRTPLPTAELPNVAFRMATEADTEDIYTLVRQRPFDLIQPEHRLFPPTSCFVLAVVDGAARGCGALTVFPLKQNGRPERAEVRAVIVDAEYEHRGIGQQLVVRLINLAIDSHVWELLSVTRIREWFERLGFAVRRGSAEAWFMSLNGKIK